MAATSASPLYSVENGVPSEKSPMSTSHTGIPRPFCSVRIFCASAARRAMPPMLRRSVKPFKVGARRNDCRVAERQQVAVRVVGVEDGEPGARGLGQDHPRERDGEQADDGEQA